MGLFGCVGKLGRHGGDMLEGDCCNFMELTADLEGPGGLPTFPPPLLGDTFCLLLGLDVVWLEFMVGMPE